jgi:hypothetical protein
MAKTLGIHIQAAIQWKKISARDWAAYYGSRHSGCDLRRSTRIPSLVWYGARAPAYVS